MSDPATVARRLPWLALVLVAYALAGAFGLRFAHLDARVSLVWAPTGLAIASVVLLGRWTWPALWAGAFLVNALASAPPWVAALMATGNTLEALAAAWLLERVGFRPALERARDAIALLGLAVPLAPVISATLGVAALGSAGVVTLERAPTLWAAWYVGDVLGALIVFPPIACWFAARRVALAPLRWLEGLGLVALSAGVAALAFGRWGLETHGYPLESLPLPVVVWAALRHGPRGVTVASFVVAVAATVATISRAGGGFDAQTVHEGVALLWTFVAITAGTGLLLAATMAERTSALREQERAARALRAVVEGTSGAVGDALLASLTRHLARALDVGHVVVLDTLTPERLRVRGRWPLEAGADDLPLTGSAAAATLQQGLLAVERGARARFPADAWLSAVAAEGCLGAPIRDAAGRPIGALLAADAAPFGADALARDLITVCASRAAAELARARDEQERRLLEHRSWHDQKSESIAVLAGGVAHDFNNLLVGVLGNASRLLADLRPDAPTYATVKRIETAARRAADLTHQLLAYAGRARLASELVDVSSLVEEMIDLITASISKRIELTRELSATRPVQGDATQLRQVVMNLLTNASDAIGDEPGRIVVRTSDEALDAGALRTAVDAPDLPAGRYVVLEVRDTGCGMDRETVARVFEPFFTTKFTGRGLGMPAVQGIVRAHRGAIFVESAPGAGTTLRVALPVESIDPSAAPATSTATTPAEAAGRPARRPGLILVADDEAVVREVAAEALQAVGHRVLAARDGQEAVELLAIHGPALGGALLDLNMPRLGGVEVLRELRRARPTLPVVMISGYTTATIDGTDPHLRFLPKPFTPAELVRALDEVLATA